MAEDFNKLMAGLDIRSILTESLGIWLKNLLPFTYICLVVLAPAAVIGYLLWLSPLIGTPYLFFTTLTNTFFSNVAVGAILYAVVKGLQGEKVGANAGIAKILSSLVPFMSVVALYSVGYAIAVIPVITGIIFSLFFLLALPVMVFENPGVIESFRASIDLVKGKYVPIAILMMIVSLLYVAAGLVSSIVGGIVGAIPGIGEFLYQAVAVAAYAVATAPVAVVTGVLYHTLRNAPEGAATAAPAEA